MKKSMLHPFFRRSAGLVLGLCITLSAQAQTLKDVVQNVVYTNPEVRKEIALWRSYRFDVRQGEAGFYPKVDLNAGIGYEEVKNSTADTMGDGLTRRELSLRLTENLFHGWFDTHNVERLKARRDAQALQVEAAAQKVALDTVRAWLEVMRYQELVKIAQQNIQTHRQILQQIKLRFDSGLSDEVELDQAKARLALAESNLVAQQSKLADARARYHRMVGHEAPNQMVLPNFDAHDLPPDLETAMSIALMEHPKLRSAYADVAEAKAQYLTRKSAYYPRVDAELSRSWNEDINGIKGSNENLQAMLRLRYNLYNGGGDKAQVDSTAALYQQATEIRNSARREVMESLRFAWNAMNMAENQMNYLEKHITLTRRTLLGYRKQFSLGRRSLLDVLNTESEYNRALVEMTNARYDLLTARYRVLEGLGRLLEDLGVKLDLARNEREYHEQ